MGFVVSLLISMDCSRLGAAVKTGLSLYRKSGKWVLGMIDILGLFDRSENHCATLQACFWKRVARESILAYLSAVYIQRPLSHPDLSA